MFLRGPSWQEMGLLSTPLASETSIFSEGAALDKVLIIIIAPHLLKVDGYNSFWIMKGMRFGRSFYFMSQKGFFPPKDITHLPFLYSYVILLHFWHLKYYRNASESLPLIFLGNPTLLWYNLFLEAWWILLESFDYVLLFKQFSDLSFILLAVS